MLSSPGYRARCDVRCGVARRARALPTAASQVLTIFPRFVFANFLEEDVYIMQWGTSHRFRVPARSPRRYSTPSLTAEQPVDTQDFRWLNPAGRRDIVLSFVPAGDASTCSGRFNVDGASRRYVFDTEVFAASAPRRPRFVSVDIGANARLAGVTQIAFGPARGAPMRIENRSTMRMAVSQADAKRWVTVDAGTSAPYCLDEPTLPALLRVRPAVDDKPASPPPMERTSAVLVTPPSSPHTGPAAGAGAVEDVVELPPVESMLELPAFMCRSAKGTLAATMELEGPVKVLILDDEQVGASEEAGARRQQEVGARVAAASGCAWPHARRL
jgi:hypothetical protein